MDLNALVDSAGVAATGVLFLLVGLSVVQVAIVVERAITFFQSRSTQRRLNALTATVDAGLFEEAADALDDPRSLAESVLAAGLLRAGDGADAVAEVVRARTAEGKLALERRLPFLATLGNNAPFIGLLGTVLGIIHAFANLSMAGGQVSAEVMSGISEALIATGVGLLVALPAVIAFNWFQRIIKNRVVATESLCGALIAALRTSDARHNRLTVLDKVA
jgi:biopolymer transport protein ExbB